MKKRNKNFYSPSTDPDGSYTGTRKDVYGKEILPGIVPGDIPLDDETPVQDVDDL